MSQRKQERDDGMGRLRVDHPRGYKTASGVELELGGGVLSAKRAEKAS